MRKLLDFCFDFASFVIPLIQLNLLSIIYMQGSLQGALFCDILQLSRMNKIAKGSEV